MRRVCWNELDPTQRRAALARPALSRADDVTSRVARIVEQVRAEGDAALLALTRQLDGATLDAFAVSQDEFDAAERSLPDALKAAIDAAYLRIRAFHEATAPQPIALETAPGVRCERILRPIERVGLYVPAGSAPLPSTALMLGIPAQVAACRQVILCTPPRADGTADPAVLFAARRCGIAHVLKLGGAQAIAAMAYGTETVPSCDKLFGPGNAYVTEAKIQVSAAAGGVAIDMPAGPSEVMVIADAQADPRFVAADLLSQAEHGTDSQALLVSDCGDLIDAVLREVEAQLAALPRQAIAGQSIAASCVFEVASMEQALEVANAYAPEHLILQVRDARRWLSNVWSAGSVFLGAYAPESVGDYCSGTNHVLPTYGAARAWSGVSVASFLKQITVQELSREGLAAIGPCAMTLARAEGLLGHERAVGVRLEDCR
jgi:histidinol dehydrogenase